MSGQRKTMAVLTAVLGIGVATASVLGPLVLDVLVYRTSATTLNQVMGGDVAALAIVMYANGYPDGSLVNVIVSTGFTAAIGWLGVRLYRPLFATALTDIPERTTKHQSRGDRRREVTR